MTDFTAPYSIRAISQGLGDALAERLLAQWQRDRGIIERGGILTQASPHLVLLEADAPADDSPPILFIGGQSLTHRLLPHLSSSDIEEPRTQIDARFRRLVSAGYRAAIAGEPYFDLVAATYNLRTGPTRIVYDRLILPWRTQSGRMDLMCYSICREVRQLSAPSSTARQPVSSSRHTGHHLSLPVASASVSHAGTPG